MSKVKWFVLGFVLTLAFTFSSVRAQNVIGNFFYVLITRSALALTSTDGAILQNTTAATGGATVQMSPRIRLRGTAWDTAASQTLDWLIENLPATAATPTSTLRLGHSLNGAATTFPMTVTSAGAVAILSPQITAGADATVVSAGEIREVVYKTTLTPVGAVNCVNAFKAAALTADCTIATLPAKTQLVGVYADVTAAFTCSGTCTGTKVMQAGTAAGGTQILAASLDVTTTARYGLVDADLGSSMVRSAAVQGGFIPSWTATTPVSVRFTSGTGNWGNATTTFVNAGSVTFYLITLSMP